MALPSAPKPPPAPPPSPQDTAKALRQRSKAIERAKPKGIPQVGTGNIFQRRRAGMEQVLGDVGR